MMVLQSVFLLTAATRESLKKPQLCCGLIFFRQLNVCSYHLFFTLDILLLISIGAQGIVDVKGEKFRVCLDDVMIFTTGVQSEPPLGFQHKPSIKFCSGRFPRANTCINCLFLPTALTTYDDFLYAMCFAILNAGGYGKV